MNLEHEPTEVADGVFRINAPLGERVVSVYLVRGDDEALLFDTGVDGTIPEYVTPALASLGVAPSAVSTIVISHCDVDHYGGMMDGAETFGDARIVAHAEDAAEIEDFDTYLAHRGRGFKDDYGLDEDDAVIEWSRSVARERDLDGQVVDGDVLSLGGRDVEIWHVPGHSRGHLALAVGDAGALIISDAVLGDAVLLADGSAAFPPTYRFVEDYRRTIARVATANPDMLLTAHYPTFQGSEVADFLNTSAHFTDHLEALVRAELGRVGGEAATLEELVAALNPGAGRWPSAGTVKALAFPVAGHLEQFMTAGEVVRADDRLGVPAWRLA